MVSLLSKIPQAIITYEHRVVKINHPRPTLMQEEVMRLLHENKRLVESISFQQSALENIFMEVIQS